MILNNVRHETGKFFTDIYNNIEDSRDAYRVIKRYTGHKNKSDSPKALFIDSSKNNSISGPENISKTLANNFASNNNLTFNSPPIHQPAVLDSINMLNRQNPIIPFNNNGTPDITDLSHMLYTYINPFISVDALGFLTTGEEVSEIIKSRSNKKSHGSDCLPYFLIKQFNEQII